tara:strand:- start:3407 stop:4213 length:807 start_codon:yes stop_codon:yes gene_type:complete
VKILITGGNGYIAKSLHEKFSDKYDITSVSRKDFDLSDPIETFKWFEDKKFDVVIHTAIVGGNRLQEDDHEITKQNLLMYYNLMQNKKSFGRLLSFGSGAEVTRTNTPYGLSKRLIADSIAETENFYNIIIFAVFDENELDRRFIKSNIKRYIENKPMIVHSDKVMDFFYMEDLCSLVDYYIQRVSPPKKINASYENKYSLRDIANMINQLGKHIVPVEIKNEHDPEVYAGSSDLPIKCVGLFRGIEKTYLTLKKQSGIVCTENISHG